jgi:hypothetical protein
MIGTLCRLFCGRAFHPAVAFLSGRLLAGARSLRNSGSADVLVFLKQLIASDVHLAVFVLEVEPASGSGLRLRPISTTVVGITRTSSKRLLGEGFLWADTTQDSATMDLLRAHFRAEEAFVNKALSDIGYQLPFWRNHYRNSAGELDTIPEVIIEDPGAKDMERLFGSDLES